MFKNYFKTAWRNIIKNKTFSFINIIGLAVSMSVCFLTILIIADQKSYDQFQTNKDRIYRIETAGKNGNEMRVASSALPLADELRKNYTGIKASATLVRNIGGDILYKDKIASGGGYFADGNLFKVMDFKLKEGNSQTALENPFSMVLSQELAQQLFPNGNAIGKTIKFNDTGINPAGFEKGNRETTYGNFLITGVLAPVPGKTNLPFKLLASLSTLNSLTKDSILNYPPNDWNNVWSNYTFVLLQKGKTQTDLQNILDKVSDKEYPKGAGNQYAFKARNITDVSGELMGNNTSTTVPKLVLIVLSILCLIVMLSACLNYTNLSVARLLTRAKEVGVRKVAGATRKQIFGQFITEAVVVSLVSFIFSLIILHFLQLLFSALSFNQYLNITFHYTPKLYFIFIGFSLLVGFIAGLLPAIYISLFKPVDIFKSLNSIKLFKRLTLRKVLLVTQFCVSLIFIITTSLIYLQGKHILNFNYGFNKDNVVNITLFKTENYDRFAQAVSSNRNIVDVSACSFLPVTGTQLTTLVRKEENHKDSLNANYIDVDAGCINVWGLKLIAGKNLPEIPAENTDRYVLINQEMVHDFNYASAREAVGQHMMLDSNDAEIVGVVKDFHFTDVAQQNGPLILRNRKSNFGYITVRMSSNNVPETLAFLQSTWKKVNPSTKFEYQFFDQQLLMTHSLLSDVASVISLLSFLAVLISCMGLLGMATYTAETRQKEIGIRKVLGSSVLQVIMLLSKSYLVLLTIAIVIAAPIAYMVNNMWLQFFASRVSISPLILLVNILILGVISLIIVFSQAWRVSVTNPVKSLRTE